MTDSRWERLAPLTGVAFLLLLVAGLLVGGTDTPDFVGPPEEIAQYYEEDEGKILAGGVLTNLAAFAFLWFLGSLRSALARAEGGNGRLSAVAFAGGVAGATLLIASNAVMMLAALRVQEQDRIDPQVATVYYDLNTAFFGMAAPTAFAVLMAATALVAIRTGALPVALGWLAALMALGFLIAPIAWIVMLALVIWVAITGIVLYSRGGGAAAADRPAAEATTGA